MTSDAAASISMCSRSDDTVFVLAENQIYDCLSFETFPVLRLRSMVHILVIMTEDFRNN